MLKLRLSYGASGNNRIPDNAWQKTFSVQTNRLVFNNSGIYEPWIGSSNTLSNDKLKWETTITKNLGFDFAAFDQRISGTLEFYLNRTRDLLINMKIPNSTGYTEQWQNTGKTSNRGVEFSIDGVIIRKKDFNFNASFNIGFNKNMIDNLGSAESWIASTNFQGVNYTGRDDYLIEAGRSVGIMYGYETDGMYSFDDFIYDPTTESYTLKEGIADDSETVSYISTVGFGPGALKLKDQNGDLIVNEEDKVVIGNANPKNTGGVNFLGQYKGLDLQIFFNWVYGNDIYNASKIVWTSSPGAIPYKNLLAKNYFRNIDPNTGIKINDPAQLAELNIGADMWNPLHVNGVPQSLAIEDGSFLRLNSLTFGYSLPAILIRRMGIEKLRVYTTGYNLWTWTKYSGWDPEVDGIRSTPLTPGVDYGAYPRNISFNFGLNVEF